jgi:BASS family bile acid:Na+ symporter
MTSAQLFEALARTAGVVFVVSSMLAMGLSLTVPMILRPLRRWPVVVAALAANFAAVPCSRSASPRSRTWTTPRGTA